MQENVFNHPIPFLYVFLYDDACFFIFIYLFIYLFYLYMNC